MAKQAKTLHILFQIFDFGFWIEGGERADERADYVQEIVRLGCI